MSPRARKILLAAAVFCSFAAAFAFYRRYRPLEGTAYRYEIRDDGRVWRIRDLDSTNGTLVNDVDVDTCVLRDGDLLTLGLLNLEFRES